jgi:hypothetical protein
MLRGILAWLLADRMEREREVLEWVEDEEEEEVKPVPQVSYDYWPQFDDDEPTLEMAYNFYEENSICHLCQNQKVRCYLEYPERENIENRLTRI